VGGARTDLIDGAYRSAGDRRIFGGQAGIAAFADLRWITIETQAGHFPN
jgi:hypothetical protein